MRTTRTPDLAYVALSKKQRTALAMLARRAWQQWGHGEAPDAWRHAQCIRVCGRRITQATQRDYLPLKAHFMDLLGESGIALDLHLQAEDQPYRIALYKLKQTCSRRHLSLDYPAAICRRQFKCSLAQASAKQIWNLIFTVRNRKPASTP